MGSDPDSIKSKLSGIDTTFKSTLVFKIIEGFKYSVKISHKNTTAVNVMKSIEPGSNASNWLLRFDNPHKNALFPHLNVRHKYTGIKDPHMKLPPGALTVAQGGAYIGKALDWLCYLTVIVDGIQLGQAIYKDHKEGTMNNTTECAVDKTGQYVGGFVGAAIGKTVGSFLIPGIGPLVGAFALGYLGLTYGKNFSNSCIQNYWSQLEREKQMLMKMEREKQELMIFNYYSRQLVNPFCD